MNQLYEYKNIFESILYNFQYEMYIEKSSLKSTKVDNISIVYGVNYSHGSYYYTVTIHDNEFDETNKEENEYNLVFENMEVPVILRVTIKKNKVTQHTVNIIFKTCNIYGNTNIVKDVSPNGEYSKVTYDDNCKFFPMPDQPFSI